MWNMNEMEESIDTNIDRISHRVKTIAETSFIPAAYAISELAAAGVIILLFFVKLDPFYEGLVLFFVINMLLIALLLLIKDMDNPFEVGKKTYADIDLFLLWDLEENLNEKTQTQKRIDLNILSLFLFYHFFVISNEVRILSEYNQKFIGSYCNIPDQKNQQILYQCGILRDTEDWLWQIIVSGLNLLKQNYDLKSAYHLQN
jgi:hypothetical protein